MVAPSMESVLISLGDIMMEMNFVHNSMKTAVINETNNNRGKMAGNFKSNQPKRK